MGARNAADGDDVTGGRRSLERAYVKASNTDAGDLFGTSVALDGAGTALAVGATEEASGAIGYGGDQADDSAENAGAVYLY